MRRNILNVLCVIGAPLFESTLAPRRSIAFRNSAGTWSRAPGKQFGVLDRWRDRHTRPARWSDTLRIRPVRWRKWNRIRIDLARLADPINDHEWTNISSSHYKRHCIKIYTCWNVTTTGCGRTQWWVADPGLCMAVYCFPHVTMHVYS